MPQTSVDTGVMYKGAVSFACLRVQYCTLPEIQLKITKKCLVDVRSSYEPWMRWAKTSNSSRQRLPQLIGGLHTGGPKVRKCAIFGHTRHGTPLTCGDDDGRCCSLTEGTDGWCQLYGSGWPCLSFTPPITAVE